MNGLRRQSRRDGGIPCKRDTPVKAVRRTREVKRKLLPRKHYDTLMEEPEVDDVVNEPTVPPTGQVLVTSGNSRYQRAPRPVPVNTECCPPKVPRAGPPSTQVRPILKTLEAGDPCSMEPGVTFTSEEDDDDCCTTTSTPWSSFPSPEVFRGENTVETLTFPSKEELMDPHHIKNSTLLDVSHAENIHMHPPPDLTPIIDASTLFGEKQCERHSKNPEPESEIETDSFETALTRKPSPETTEKRLILFEKRLILFKKKVQLKSSITRNLKGEHIASSVHTTSGPPTPQDRMKTNARTSKRDAVRCKGGALSVTVILKKSAQSSEEARFFDFDSGNDRDVFMQATRERCEKLKGNFIFPSTLNRELI